jgi:hypothetical protein
MQANNTTLKIRYSQIVDPFWPYNWGRNEEPQGMPADGSIVYIIRREKLAGAIGYQRTGKNVTYYLRAEPQRTNQSHEQRVRGWLGTNDNVEHTALGRYEVAGGSSTHAWFRRLSDDADE